MIPKIIHIISVGGKPLSELQERALKAVSELLPEWDVRVWRDPISPEGFRLAHYWPYANSGAQLADLIRLDIIFRFGGVYIDSDVLLKKPLDELVHHCDFFIASEDGNALTNAVFGAHAEHPALDALIRRLLGFPPDWSLPPNVTTGPQLFSRVLKWREDVTVLPRDCFNPYSYGERPRNGHIQSYGEHVWVGSWAKKGAVQTFRQKLSQLRPKRLAKTVLRWAQERRLTNEFLLRLTQSNSELISCESRLIRRTIHGHSVLLDGNDVSVTPEIARNGYYELEEEMFLRRTLKGGDFFIDVGANVGVFAMLASLLVGPFGRVFAYEPNPSVASLLRKSAAMNWMHERIFVREVGVGSESGEAVLAVCVDRLGDSSIKRDDAVGPGSASQQWEEMTVPIVALDAEFPYDVPIKMLKIDAEGYEADVLKGARRLIERQCIDYILLEVIEDVVSVERWHGLLSVLKEICSSGYRPFVFGRHGKIMPTNIDHFAWHGGRGRNLVLRSTKAAA